VFTGASSQALVAEVSGAAESASHGSTKVGVAGVLRSEGSVLSFIVQGPS
jgi:hypothetical protein